MSLDFNPQPTHFLKVRVSRLDLKPTLHGLCAGYELQEWRYDQFARHLIRWLPEFALTFSEYQAFKGNTGPELLSRAAREVYTSKKYKKRGECGEILLHAVIRQCFKTYPAISKMYFKDGTDETVKGLMQYM